MADQYVTFGFNALGVGGAGGEIDGVVEIGGVVHGRIAILEVDVIGIEIQRPAVEFKHGAGLVGFRQIVGFGRVSTVPGVGHVENSARRNLAAFGELAVD